MLRIDGLFVESQEEEEKFEYAVVGFNAEEGDEVDHPFVDLAGVDIAIDEGERLEEGENQVADDYAFIVAVVGFGKGHHQYFIQGFNVFVVDCFFEVVLLIDHHGPHIFGDNLYFIFDAGELISVFDDAASFPFLSIFLIVLVSADIQQHILLLIPHLIFLTFRDIFDKGGGGLFSTFLSFVDELYLLEGSGQHIILQLFLGVVLLGHLIEFEVKITFSISDKDIVDFSLFILVDIDVETFSIVI